MRHQSFPDFLRRLPEADLPYHGLRGWLLQGGESQLLFMESAIEVFVPEHSHGDQWGFVIDGKMDLTIGAKTETYERGDAYFIPSGTPHKAVLHPGFRAVDYFADRDRYRALPPKAE